MTDYELIKTGWIEVQPVYETELAYKCIDHTRSRLEGPPGTTYVNYVWFLKRKCKTDQFGRIYVRRIL